MRAHHRRVLDKRGLRTGVEARGRAPPETSAAAPAL
jgi:hypothetical protein